MQTKTLPGKIGHYAKYLEHIPASYDPVKGAPLLLFFHGQGEVGTDIEVVKRNGPPQLISAGKWPASLPYIVICPQSAVNYPQPDNVNDLLFYLKSVYNITTVHLTGLSMGGATAMCTAAKYPDMCTAMFTAATAGASCAKDVKRMPYRLALAHNKDDGTVMWYGSQQWENRAKELGATCVAVYHPLGGHNAWGWGYDPNSKEFNGGNVYDFMLAGNVVAPPVDPPPPAKELKQTIKFFTDGTYEIE